MYVFSYLDEMIFADFEGGNQLNDPFNSKDTATNAFFPLNLPIVPGAFDGSEIRDHQGCCS